MSDTPPFHLACPAPLRDYREVTLAHGAGGALTQSLIDGMITPLLGNAWLAAQHDGAVLESDGPLAFTTDSYVVQPLVFPGGDIGKLAVCGTLNDLAMCGARPARLSLGLIIEEGLAMQTLWQIVSSIAHTCTTAGVQVVTGDTKVVERGKGDGVFLNMSGLGPVVAPQPVTPERIAPGDAIVLSGDVGRHGIAVLSAREGMDFETRIDSDCAPLHDMALALIEAGLDVHCLRDLTRGGLATALIELSETSGHGMRIHERTIPVSEGVRGAAELLGLDPLFIANEGRFCAVLPACEAARAVNVLSGFTAGEQAAVIGTVGTQPAGLVLENTLGGRRRLQRLTGEPLPRIC